METRTPSGAAAVPLLLPWLLIYLMNAVTLLWSNSLLKAARQAYVRGLMALPWNVLLERRDLLCREMLRIKRSVAASFSQVHYNTTVVEATTAAGTAGMACCLVTL